MPEKVNEMVNIKERKEEKITKVYGDSDDNVYFDGEIDGQYSRYDAKDGIIFLFSDGSIINFRYDDPGIWKATILTEGKLFDRIQYETNPDADIHSDIVFFKSGLTWSLGLGDWNKFQNEKEITKIYGQRDHIWYFNGVIERSYSRYDVDEGVLFVFSDGTAIIFRCEDNGLWKATVMLIGTSLEMIPRDINLSDSISFKPGVKWMICASEWERIR